MNCENVLELMLRELDGALTVEEAAALQAHLAACADCRETYRRLHAQEQALLDSELEPPAALHSRVMQQISREAKTKKRRAWIPAAAIAAAAALVLLAGRLGLVALPGFEKETSVTVGIGAAAERIFMQLGAQEPDEAAALQAAELSAAQRLDVLLVWDSGIPAELDGLSYEKTQSGARLYRVPGAAAQTILDSCTAAIYSPDDVFSDLPEKEAVCVLVFE